MQTPMAEICEALDAAGLLPVDRTVAAAAWEAASSKELLPLLTQLWNAAPAAVTRGEGAVRTRQWLQIQEACGAELSLGIAGCDDDMLARWLGPRLAWWPRGVPQGRRVGLISSRLGRKLDCQQAWFKVLRTACAQIDPQKDVLLTAASTTTARFIERCASLFGLRLLRVDLAADDMPLAKWFLRVRDQQPAETTDWRSEVFLSPPLAPLETAAERDADYLAAPSRDRAVVAMSDRLLVFHLRRGGHSDRLVRARLTDRTWPLASVYVALGPDLVRRDAAHELLGLGAVGWMLMEKPQTEQCKFERSESIADTLAIARIIPVPSAEDWPYLTHCTRRRDGPWPDQGEQDYLDDLILQRAGADHSPLAALWRLVVQQRIIATSETIRGATGVVSFTNIPLAELGRLHTFRPHRARWDFEPYGICIRRDWLERRGSRPVYYGDDELWDRLPPGDRPYFQLRQTRRSTGADVIDWTVEQEWRHIGDVLLRELPADAALLFVSAPAEAEQLSSVSRWPVTSIQTL
jgi:hypothetical protein